MSKNLSKFTDKELVQLMSLEKSSADAAFTELYDRYALRVNAYCRVILNSKEAAEDIFQETFIKFYQNVRSDYKFGSVIGFLITIARNLCLNYKRDKKVSLPLDGYDFPVYDRLNHEEVEETEFNEIIIMSLDLLEPEVKEILIMRVFNDLHYNEISKIVGISAARARYLVYNAKLKLKGVLTPYVLDNMNS